MQFLAVVVSGGINLTLGELLASSFGDRSKIFKLVLPNVSVFSSLYACLCILIINRFPYKGDEKSGDTFIAFCESCQIENPSPNTRRRHV